MTFNAYRLSQQNRSVSAHWVEMTFDELDPGDIVIKTMYAGINFKDALAATGKASIIRRFPCIGGIEVVGEVVESSSQEYRTGDRVIVHGRGLGVSHNGGFAEYVRVPADWVVALPEGLDMREAASLGVAGHTAAIAIELLEHNGLAPQRGRVAVTGATGGVSSLGIDMLSGLEYDVVAISRSLEHQNYLKKLGANDVIIPPKSDPDAKLLDSEQWAGALDATGGDSLAWLLKCMARYGSVACFGNAAGIELNTTVLPFILRGVRLLGVNADTEKAYRQRLWSRLAGDLKPRHLDEITETITPEELPRLLTSMVNGETVGRYLIDFR